MAIPYTSRYNNQRTEMEEGIISALSKKNAYTQADVQAMADAANAVKTFTQQFNAAMAKSDTLQKSPAAKNLPQLVTGLETSLQILSRLAIQFPAAYATASGQVLKFNNTMVGLNKKYPEGGKNVGQAVQGATNKVAGAVGGAIQGAKQGYAAGAAAVQGGNQATTTPAPQAG